MKKKIGLLLILFISLFFLINGDIKAEQVNHYYCSIVNGDYYDATGKIVSESEYKASCPLPLNVCTVVDGKYYDAKGTQVDKDSYEKSCSGFECEYKKVTNATWSAYGPWSEWNTKEIVASDAVEVETKTEKVITGYTTETYQSGYTTEKRVVGYDKKTTIEEYLETEYKYVSSGSGTKFPDNTEEYVYVKTSSTTEQACYNCAIITTYTWDVYKVENTTHTRVIEEPVPIYEDVTTPVYSTRKVPVYGTEIYYRSRTRTLTGGSIDTKWSTCNPVDASLTEQGYQLTGNKRKTESFSNIEKNNVILELNGILNENYILSATKVSNVGIKINNYDYVVGYDIHFYDKNNGEVISIKDNKLKIKIPLVKKEYDKYIVAYINNGKIEEKIDATYENGYVVFTTTHLSTYVVYGEKVDNNKDENSNIKDDVVNKDPSKEEINKTPEKEEKPAEDKKPTLTQTTTTATVTNTETIPNTGDDVLTYLLVALCSGIMIVILILRLKKVDNN